MTSAQLSYAHGTSAVPLLGDTIGANLERAARRFPDREALVDRPTGRRWTYAELNAAADTVARGLMSRGIAKGDRVGIWAPNCAEWVLVQYATAKIGAILVTLNPAYRSHELAYALNQSGVKLVVSATRHKSSDYVAMVGEVWDEVGSLNEVIYLGTEDWDALVADGAKVSPRDLAARGAMLSPDDPINIQYTSGTTGYPKGATLSHHNILNNGYFVARICGYTEADRICVPVPLYHCFGMVMAVLAACTHGCTVVFGSPSFEPAATLAAVAEERCTSLYGVPTMFIGMLSEPDFGTYDLSSLRTGIMAGSPCPVEVMKRVIAEMGMDEVTICYGMTETSPVSTQTRRDDDLERRTSTVGTVHPHVEVKIVDPVSGLTLPRGLPGELCTRGYSVMLGYWEEPDRTAEVIDSARWMHTGDLATMDAQGYVNVVGRIKDMIIRGGENIYPREIEEFLYSHPKVLDVQVVGVPDAKYGEELCAWVRLREGETATEDEIRDHCKGRLAHYKVPRYVRFVDAFPQTVTGKIRKVQMREESIKALGLENIARERHA